MASGETRKSERAARINNRRNHWPRHHNGFPPWRKAAQRLSTHADACPTHLRPGKPLLGIRSCLWCCLAGGAHRAANLLKQGAAERWPVWSIVATCVLRAIQCLASARQPGGVAEAIENAILGVSPSSAADSICDAAILECPSKALAIPHDYEGVHGPYTPLSSRAIPKQVRNAMGAARQAASQGLHSIGNYATCDRCAQ